LQLHVKKDGNRASTVDITAKRSLGGFFEIKREINKNEGENNSKTINKV